MPVRGPACPFQRSGYAPLILLILPHTRRLSLLQGNYVQIVIERMQREERLQREAEKQQEQLKQQQQQQQSPGAGAGMPPPSPGGATSSAAPGFRRR